MRFLNDKNLLVQEKVDIAFLTETDTRALKTKKDFKIEGYSTVFQNRENDSELLRIICLIKSNNIGCSNLSQNTFIEDSKRLWNNVPDTIKNASTLYMAKKEIKKYCAIFPM